MRRSDTTEPRKGLNILSGLLTAWCALAALVLTTCNTHSPEARRLPPAIADVEIGAESIFDLINQAKWDRAEKRTAYLRRTVARLEATQHRESLELENAVSALERAIEARDVSRACHAANEVMRQAVQLGSDQLRRDSIAVLMLDVETREILMDADTDPAAADAAVSRVRELWSGLRPAVEQRGETNLADRCDHHLHQLEVGSASIRRTEAAALLETIDRLERIFT